MSHNIEARYVRQKLCTELCINVVVDKIVILQITNKTAEHFCKQTAYAQSKPGHSQQGHQKLLSCYPEQFKGVMPCFEAI